MDRRVLIVTHRADLHADIVTQKVLARGSRPFRLNLDEFPKDFAVTLTFPPNRGASALTHIPTGDSLSIADIGAIWVRKRAPFTFLSKDLSPQERAHAEAEMEHLLFGILYSADCYWVSHPRAIRGACWKAEQLARAARLGFNVPVSIISNRRDRVEEFRRSVGGDIIFKTLSSPFLAADEVDAKHRIAAGLPTTRITDEHDELLDAVVELPSLFQKNIPKQYELRVTVIADKLFAARIHSQEDPRTMIDYRDYSAEIAYEATKLPPDVERRCRDFVRSYDLNFGALDLIVTPSNEYVFLENNPVGQFLFVEQLVPELNMAEALAQCLIEGMQVRDVSDAFPN